MTARISVAASALLLLMMPLSAGIAQEPDMARAVAVCDGKFGLCRYIDRVTRQEMLPARFERAMPFSEGVAAVRIDGRFRLHRCSAARS